MHHTESRIEIIQPSVINRRISICQDKQILDLQAQGMLTTLYYPDGRLGQGHLYLFYEPKTCLCVWEFIVDSLTTKHEYIGNATDKPSLLSYSNYSDAEKRKLIETDFNYFLKVTFVYSSKTELLYFSQYGGNLFFRAPKDANEQATTFELARQKVLLSISRQLNEFEKYGEYGRRMIDYPMESSAAQIDGGHFFLEILKQRENETVRQYQRRRKISLEGPTIVAKISQVKRVSNGWRIVMESTENRWMTYLLDEDFNVLDAVIGVVLT